MAITDYNRVKKISPTTQNDSGTTQDKAQPILLVDGDDSTTGTGDIVIDFANIAGPEDIAVYDQNGNLLDYEIEDLDTTNNTAVLWCYNSWTRDDTVQAQIAYGDNSANTDRQNVTATWGNTGQNLLAVWHLDETSGTTIDSTSNNNDSVSTTGTIFDVSGEFDGARDFDGTDDIIDFGNIGFEGLSEFTILSYVNFDVLSTGNQQGIVYNGGSSANDTFFFAQDDGSSGLRLNINSGSVDLTGGSLNTNEWYQTVAAYSDSNSKSELFVDASSAGTDGVTGAVNSTSETLKVGGRGDKSNSDATFDAVRIYTEDKSFLNGWIQADYDASPKAGQVYFSQQAAEPIATDKTASIPVTQNTQTTPDPQVQAGTVTVSTPTTVLTQTTENPQLQAGATSLTIQETQLTATNPDINLQPGVSRIQVTPTSLTQTTENPAVNATFDLSIPETELTATNPEPSVTLADIVLVPETQLDQTTPDIQVQPGDSPISVPETQLTATNPEITLNRRIVFGVVTQLNATNPEPNLEPGIVQVNIPETQLIQTTENPQVEPGEATVQVTPPTDLTVFTPDIQVTPGNTDLQIGETQLIQTTPEPNLGLDLQFVSPTNALITNNNRYFDMPDHTFKQNDFGDTFTATLKDDDNPNGVSIQGNTGVTLVIETFDGQKVLDKEMNVTDAQNGKVEYVWETGDFIEDIGVYKAEIKVFDASNEPETFPNQGYRSVTVEDELE